MFSDLKVGLRPKFQIPNISLNLELCQHLDMASAQMAILIVDILASILTTIQACIVVGILASIPVVRMANMAE